MKYPSAYYMLLIYMVALCKPVLPYIQDFFAHTFNEMAHVNKVHNGMVADHVEKEVRNAAQESNPENTTGKQKSLNDEPFHILATYFLLLHNNTRKLIIQYCELHHHFPTVFIGAQYPPPKA